MLILTLFGDFAMADTLPTSTPLVSPPNSGGATRIPVLEYHDSEYKGGPAVQMTTAWFQDQMKWLSDNGFKTLSGAEILQFVEGTSQPAQKSVILRFDLGNPVYPNFRDVILPTLQKYGFTAHIFLLTSNIKDTCVNNFPCWEKLREWEQTGLVEFGSHGINHPDYARADTNTRVWDARESKRVIESKLGHPISFFSFPYDSVPSAADALLKACGYRLAFAGYTRLDRSVQYKDPKPYALPCYYPYSSPGAYPLLTTTTTRQTFEQLMLAAVKNPTENAPLPVRPVPAPQPDPTPILPPAPPPAATPRLYRVNPLESGTAAEYSLNTAFKPLVLLPVPYISQLGAGADAHLNDSGAAAVLMLLHAYLNLNLLPDDFYPTFGISTDSPLSLLQLKTALTSRAIPADLREKLTLQDLFVFLAASKPVIIPLNYQVLAQAGLTEQSPTGTQYSVVVGLDARNIYLHDPLYSNPVAGQAHPYPLDLFWRAWKETATDLGSPLPERSAILPSLGLGFSLTRRVRVSNSTLNVRSGPGLNYQPLKMLKVNEIVEVDRELNGWGQVTGVGWIALAYTVPA